jgi:Winged helix-turn helix
VFGSSKVETSLFGHSGRMPGPLMLSMKKLDRLQVMARIAERRLTRRRAAELLDLSERHIRRLYDAFAADGASSLASRRRGRPSGRRLVDATRARAPR